MQNLYINELLFVSLGYLSPLLQSTIYLQYNFKPKFRTSLAISHRVRIRIPDNSG